MRHRLFVHLTWITRDRQPLIEVRRAEFLARYLPSVARQERAEVWEMGIVSTHVHLLVRLHPAADISRLVQRFKGGSAVLAEREGHGPKSQPLRWAKGYDVQSVSLRAIPNVRRYIEQQGSHHPEEAITGWHGVATSAHVAPSASPQVARVRNGRCNGELLINESFWL